MRFTLALLGAAIAGSACASFTIDRADYLSLHRRVKSIRRTRRAQASPTVDLGTPIVLSRNVVCPTIAGFGGLVFCESLLSACLTRRRLHLPHQ